MDLLASLNIDDLPEQQTRTVELMSRHPDFDLSLGFDSCCTCGAPLGANNNDGRLPIDCPACRRVKYCSEACREQDAHATPSIVAEGEEENALGHSSIICAMLRLCHDDEAVEQKTADNLDAKRLEAAQDRVRSEYESYPATLANVIMEGPCYQKILSERASQSKRLVLHVIGASIDSELWNAEDETGEFLGAYAEAFAELADSRGFDNIEIIFIGPECPDKDLIISKPMRPVEKDRAAGELLARSYKCLYTKQSLDERDAPKANIIVFFNPGFTVPDYDWNEALACIDRGTPFLSTTNTELEGIADCQYLLDQDKIQTMPPGLAEVFGLYCSGDEEETPTDSGTAFFSVNPFSGNRVRQSGTMANDLYVKNRWILGGIMDSFDPSKAQVQSSSKKQRTTVSLNSKQGNPSLI